MADYQDEEWREIEGFPGYKISNYGRAMNFRNDPNGVLMHQTLSSMYYYEIHVSNSGKSAHPCVHKLVAQAFIDNPNNYKLVLHLDGTRDNNHVNNLMWGTRGDVKKSQRGESQYKYVRKTEIYYPVPLYDEKTLDIHNSVWNHEIYNYYNVPQKKCYHCQKVKPLDMFNKTKRYKDGHQQRCRECEKAHYREHKEGVSKTHKKYHEENKERIHKVRKVYRENNREQLLNKSKIYYQANREKIKERDEKRKDEKAKKSKERYEKKKDELLARHREYYRRNAETLKQKVHEYSASPRGREVDRLKRARRKEFGFDPINKPFEGSAFHHLHIERGGETDKGIGIYIPFELHVSVFHNNYTGQGMKEINKVALLWLAEQSII